MKILFATDGSASAQRAQALVAATAWPAPTEIDVLYVDQLFEEEVGLPERQLSALHKMLRADTDKQLAAVRSALEAPGRVVRTSVTFGRPATVIVDAARKLAVDLVVVGNRGHGAFASALLGSVAAEVVDLSPCPVLVARGDRMTSVVLAHDGSDGARLAEELVASAPFLKDLPVLVESVADVMPWWYMAGGAVDAPVNADVYQQIIDDMRSSRLAVAADAAKRLVARGVKARGEMREGTAALGVIDAAAAAKADLIVVGSRGRTGLARLLLGSVARGILFHAPCSVLIARQKVQVSPAKRPGEESVVLVGI